MLPLWIIDLNADGVRGKALRNRLTPYIADARAEAAEPRSKSAWHYTNLSYSSVVKRMEGAEDVQRGACVLTAEVVDVVREVLIEEGLSFVRRFNASDLCLQGPLNVVVLGNVGEAYSACLFPSVAALLHRSRRHILPLHVHNGFNVLGMLHIPVEVHTLSRKERQQVLRCLKELEVARQVSAVTSYTKVMFQQELQHITEKFYPSLDAPSFADMQFEQLLHLFYVGDRMNNVLFGPRMVDTYYFTMGAASIYYDGQYRKQEDLRELVRHFIVELLETPLNYESMAVEEHGDVKVLKEDPLTLVSPRFFIYMSDEANTRGKVEGKIDGSVDVEGYLRQNFPCVGLMKSIPTPFPDPVWDFHRSELKEKYYENYLRYLPSRIKQNVLDWIRPFNNEMLRAIERNCVSLLSAFKGELLEHVAGEESILSQERGMKPETGALARVQRQLELLRENLERQEARAQNWRPKENEPLIMSQEGIPSYIIEYQQYIREGGTQEYSQRIIDVLKKKLANEPTMMGLLAHSFFLGILMALGVVPVLRGITLVGVLPYLGDINANGGLWAMILFLLPLVFNLFKYHFHRKRVTVCMKKLQACYLKTAEEHAEKLFVKKMTQYYEQAKRVCDAYLDRLKEVKVLLREHEYVKNNHSLEIPKTVFNQPLLGGEFCGHKIVKQRGEEHVGGEEIVINEIEVGNRIKRINDLKPNDFYVLISNCVKENYADRNHKYNWVSPKNLFRVLFEDLSAEKVSAEAYYDCADEGEEALAKDVDMRELQRVVKELFELKRKQAERDSEALRKKILECRVEFCVLHVYNYLKQLVADRGNDGVGELLLQLANDDALRLHLDVLGKMSNTNGQMTANDDNCKVVLKCNKDVGLLLAKGVDRSMRLEVDNERSLYKRYLLCTKLRSIDEVEINRILPEDELEVEEEGCESLLFFCLKKDEVDRVNWGKVFGGLVAEDLLLAYDEHGELDCEKLGEEWLGVGVRLGRYANKVCSNMW